MQKITKKERKYRRKLILPILLISIISPGIFSLLTIKTSIFVDNITLSTIGYFLFRYILPFTLIPISLYFSAQKKSRKRVFILIWINTAIAIIRLLWKYLLHINSEIQISIIILINVYSRLNLEKTGKIFTKNKNQWKELIK